MEKFKIYNSFLGFYAGTNNSKNNTYIKAIYKGGYTFTTDFTFAKHFKSYKTALKHCNKLNFEKLVKNIF